MIQPVEIAVSEEVVVATDEAIGSLDASETGFHYPLFQSPESSPWNSPFASREVGQNASATIAR